MTNYMALWGTDKKQNLKNLRDHYNTNKSNLESYHYQIANILSELSQNELPIFKKIYSQFICELPEIERHSLISLFTKHGCKCYNKCLKINYNDILNIDKEYKK